MQLTVTGARKSWIGPGARESAAWCRARRINTLGFFVALAFALSALSAQAQDLVTNGSFEITSNGNGQLGYNTTATGWTTNGYNFIFAPGTADTTGAAGSDGTVRLWGPGDGSSNGLPATSPDGGNYVAADGAYEVGAIQQTINGLTPGDSYTVGFWWAGAQQDGFNGATTEQWQVSLGSQTQSTAIVNNPSHGFTGWTYQTFTYTAASSSEVLSFLAAGTPDGVPPFAVLDGVSLYASAPEPSSWMMVIGAVGLVGGVRRLRSKGKLAR
jgi:hypothetical protein